MHSKQALSFNSVSDLYERVRPSYPNALYEDLLAAASPSPTARILEIGAGSGIATLPFAEQGFHVSCLEPGDRLASMLRKKLDGYPNCKVLSSTFESWDLESSRFELVFSAQAFHWLDPTSRFERTARALTPEGSLAIFGNAMMGTPEAMEQSLRAAYERHAPELSGPSPTRWYAREGPIAELIRASGLFSAPLVRFYDWSMLYTTETYLDLLKSHSNYSLLPLQTQDSLFAAIGEVIESAGGSLDVQYQSSLCVAQRVSRA